MADFFYAVWRSIADQCRKPLLWRLARLRDSESYRRQLVTRARVNLVLGQIDDLPLEWAADVLLESSRMLGGGGDNGVAEMLRTGGAVFHDDSRTASYHGRATRTL